MNYQTEAYLLKSSVSSCASSISLTIRVCDIIVWKMELKLKKEEKQSTLRNILQVSSSQVNY